MLDPGGGGGSGGSYVGLDPDGARGLARTASVTSDEVATTGRRIADLLAQAGPDAAGASTHLRLAALAAALSEGSADLRWRIAVMTDDPNTYRSGNMLHGNLAFPNRRAAAAAGARDARALERAYRAYVDTIGEDDDAAREAAKDAYESLIRVTGLHADDPAYAGALVNTMGADGLHEVLDHSLWEAEGDHDEARQMAEPVFRALATAGEHRTVDPRVVDDMVSRWWRGDLAFAVSVTKPATDLLVRVAEKVLIDSRWTDDRADDPLEEDFRHVLGALARDDRASYEVMTGDDRHGFPNLSTLMIYQDVYGAPDVTRALAETIRGGLLRHPSAVDDAATWNRVTESLEHLIAFAPQIDYQLDDADPSLSVAFVDVLAPHLDQVAVIGARGAEIETRGYDLDVRLPGGRRALDVEPDQLAEYLGAAMQTDEGIKAMQLLLAGYTQRPDHQTNRLPLLDGEVDELDDFLTDSMRIAGLLAVTGKGLDHAGEDEERRTRLLTGIAKLASGQALGRLPTPNPAAWIAGQVARYGTGQAVEEFTEYLESHEPAEGEDGVDAFLAAYADTTRASLREAIADDPALARLPLAEREAILRRAVVLAENQVGGALRSAYGELVGEEG